MIAKKESIKKKIIIDISQKTQMTPPPLKKSKKLLRIMSTGKWKAKVMRSYSC